jgi:uncharacterized protein (DUF924 family)
VAGVQTKVRIISGVTSLPPLAAGILDFWFVPLPGETALDTPSKVTRRVWFTKDDAFDRAIRDRFGSALAAGLAGAYGEWCTSAHGSLARVVLLDQFTRNAFRGTPAAFTGDARALATAEEAIERGFDRTLDAHERWFLYMPFQHSESLVVQERSVALFDALARETGLTDPLPYPQRHHDVIRRFGRFPHRNGILGRASSTEELAFLREAGSRF